MFNSAVLMDKYLRSFYSAVSDYQKGFRHKLPDSCRDSFPADYRQSGEEPHALVVPDEAADLLALDPDAVKYIKETLTLVLKDNELSRFFIYCNALFFNRCKAESEYLIESDALVEKAGHLAPLFPVLVLLSGIPRIKAYYKYKGISKKILTETLGDIRVWLGNNRKNLGLWGITEFAWVLNHLNGMLFKIGRLQYMPGCCDARLHVFRNLETGRVTALSEEGIKFGSEGYTDGNNGVFDINAFTSNYITNDRIIAGNLILPKGKCMKELVFLSANTWEEVLSKNDAVLEVHIQEGERLDHELCGQSLNEAAAFFDTYFPELNYKGFTCRSWLLDPQLRNLLGESSNISRFQKEVYLYPVLSDDRQAIERIYGDFSPNGASSSKATSLQRKVNAFMQGGKRLQMGGMFLLKEDLRWGEQVYNRCYSDGFALSFRLHNDLALIYA